jgi:hypothetical protein
MKIFQLKFPGVLKFSSVTYASPERACQPERFGCSAML